MNQHSPGSPERSDAEPPVLLGPAVPSRHTPAAPPAAAEPIAPFVPQSRESREPEPEDIPVPVADLAPDPEEDDLPWLVPHEPAPDPEPAAGGELEWLTGAESVPQEPSLSEDQDSPAVEAAPQPEPDAPAPAWLEEIWSSDEEEAVEPEAPGPRPIWAEESVLMDEGAEFEPEAGTSAPDAAPPAQPLAASGAAAELADRLERIARTLRERTPMEVIAGAEDPLEMLIAGYLLGRAEAHRGTGR